MKVKQKLLVRYMQAKLNITALISKEKAAEKAFNFFATPKLKHIKINPPVFSEGIKHTINLNGIKLKGLQWNEHATRKVLILHGFESNSRNFHAYIEKLIEKDFQVIAFDAQAHGKSSGKRIILTDYIEMIEALSEQFGPFQGFLAHSFGGLALAHFLEKNQHHKNDKAVLIAPATETTTAIEHFFSLLNITTDFREEFYELIYKKSGFHASHFSINRAMENIQASILWMHDKKDFITPLSDVREIQSKNYPNIQFKISDGLGHNRIYRDEGVLNEAINFLSTLETNSPESVNAS